MVKDRQASWVERQKGQDSRMDVQLLAARQLADYDRRRPGGVFAEPGIRLSIEQSYELQFEVARLRQLRGERIAGYKIGCISHTMQDQLGH